VATARINPNLTKSMKNVLLIFFVLLSGPFAFSQTDDDPWTWPKSADYPQIAKRAGTCEGFMPTDWEQIAMAKGDLNADGKQDCAAVFKGRNKRFLFKNDGLGEDAFDTNPRVLIVALAGDHGYRLEEQNNKFIVPAGWPTMFEPFQEIEIANGVLTFHFEEFYSAGSWTAGNRKYVFRFQNGEMTLIGVDVTKWTRNTGETTTHSYNLSTGRMTIETGNIGDDGKGKVRRRPFRIRPLPTLKTVKPMLTWEIEKDIII
jgi:hypothetical protein